MSCCEAGVNYFSGFEFGVRKKSQLGNRKGHAQFGIAAVVTLPLL